MRTFSAFALSSILVLGLITSATPSRAADFSDAQTKSIEKIVHDYLVKNPEVMIEVMTELDAKQKAADKAKQDGAVSENHKQIFNDPTSFVAGNPKGDVTIVEFFDYNCGYCKRAFAPLMNTIKDDGNVRLILKEFPILGPSSVVASHAALAAEKQGKYFEMFKALYLNKGELDNDTIMAIATSIGLDIARLRKDMADPAYAKIIANNEKLAEALGVSGTPSFVIGETFHPGALTADDLKVAINDARAQNRAKD